MLGCFEDVYINEMRYLKILCDCQNYTGFISYT